MHYYYMFYVINVQHLMVTQWSTFEQRLMCKSLIYKPKCLYYVRSKIKLLGKYGVLKLCMKSVYLSGMTF